MALDTTIGGPATDSYVSVADADAYHAARGVAAALWSGLGAAKQEPALRKATQYLDAMYRYKGYKATLAQRLQWPRTAVELDGYAVPHDAYPRPLVEACCELALRATTQELTPDLSPQVVTGEQVGPLAVEYSEGQRNGGRPGFDYVDRLLEQLVLGSGSVRMERGA